MDCSGRSTLPTLVTRSSDHALESCHGTRVLCKSVTVDTRNRSHPTRAGRGLPGDLDTHVVLVNDNKREREVREKTGERD